MQAPPARIPHWRRGMIEAKIPWFREHRARGMRATVWVVSVVEKPNG